MGLNFFVIQTAVITTIGFLKEAPDVNVHGFNIYYRNRLILVSPFIHYVGNLVYGYTPLIKSMKPLHILLLLVISTKDNNLTNACSIIYVDI